MYPLIQLKKTPPLMFLVLSLAYLRFASAAQAVAPAPDGGYPGGNTAEGQNALLSLTTGTFNTAVGFLSLSSNTTTSFNTAIGAAALLANSAEANTAIGAGALLSNTIGVQNTANGAFALLRNTEGNYNTATGYQALSSNTTGGFNTAVGRLALFGNTTGDSNTAVGWDALEQNQNGSSNTAVGREALFTNITGDGHTAIGFQALHSSTASGQFCFGNTAVGSNALAASTGGCGNTAIGSAALLFNTSGSNNVAVGLLAGNKVTTSDNVICIGALAGSNITTGNNIICIGAEGEDSIASCFIGNIFGRQTTGGAQVFVNSSNRLGTSTSSKRFKEKIEAMGKRSEELFSLRPVRFRYKEEIDPAGSPQLGLVAEDVEKVNPDLVVRDKGGKPYSVRYDQVNAMLLNEFLKEHKKVQELKATIAELKKAIVRLAANDDAQAAQIQKVSAQVEMAKRSSKVVLNGP
jgi:trimeric autotransporter adhesin